jgi:hypothetical protein
MIIDKCATFVAKNGQHFEKLLREREHSNPKFAFLVPGSQKYDYYRHKLDSILSTNGTLRAGGGGVGVSVGWRCK